MSWTCQAYTEAGTLCRKPAVTVDPYRGYAVCQEHAVWVCTNCETVNPVDAEVCEDCGMPRGFSEPPSTMGVK